MLGNDMHKHSTTPATGRLGDGPRVNPAPPPDDDLPAPRATAGAVQALRQQKNGKGTGACSAASPEVFAARKDQKGKVDVRGA